MTKITLLTFVWGLLCFFSYSQQNEQPPKKLYINLSRGQKKPFNTGYIAPDRYFVIFNSHDKYHSIQNPELNSIAGHAWIILGHENPQTKKSEINGFGFAANKEVLKASVGETASNILVWSTAIPTTFFNITPPGKLLGIVSTSLGGGIGTVPGMLKEDLFLTPYSNSIKQVVVEVDKNYYDNALNVVETYSKAGQQYGGIKNDCVTFFIEVGKSIGIDMPDRSLLSPNSLKPSDYMDLFINKVSTPNSISIDNKTGDISGSENGQYVSNFNANGTDRNVCDLDNLGNLIEKRYRNGKLTCQQINYFNGDSWYTETEAEGSGIPVTNPDGSSFLLPPIKASDYRFSNGNTILNYNPITFNPNLAVVNLSSGDSYFGSISNDGTPNGNGTLNHIEFDKNNWMTGTSKTGNFINGKFQDYTGVRLDVGVFYGEFKNGMINGPARVEYYDGRIFTGNFTNGKANGIGTGTNRNNDYYVSGNFKDGVADGFCTYKNESGTYKGEIKNGSCTGNGTWWAPNGNVYEGTFSNGKFVSGKATLPNGNYYIGNFDVATGKPNGGKYYDKNGREIKDNDRQFSGGDRDRPQRSIDVKMGNEAGGWEINGVRQ